MQMKTNAIALSLVLLWCHQVVYSQEIESSSVYVTMKDGNRIAVDVHLPGSRKPAEKLPALLIQTRYWRASVELESNQYRPGFGEEGHYFLKHGYALVIADVRGSGASYGTRPGEYFPGEVLDGYDLVEWIIRQPWSNGSVGAYGTSYTGTTAELLTATGHPAVKAVIPGWSDFDVYRSPIRPYGLLASNFLGAWATMVGWMDQNNAEKMGGSVHKVDADVDGSLLKAAIAEHKTNPNVFEWVRNSEFYDDSQTGVPSYFELGPIHWRDAIQASRVPMLVLVSWMDAGTAEGALLRFKHFRNPQKLVIMATSHGGGTHASPYKVTGEIVSPEPSEQEQLRLRLDFFDHFLKGEATGVEDWPAIRYYNLGEERFRETEVWPPDGVERVRYYLAQGKLLSTATTQSGEGSDRYRIDFTTTTGPRNRFMTQMGHPVLGLHDRSEMDLRMLTYTSIPLAQDLQMTGTPQVTLQISSTCTDGSFLVYLEDVQPDGRSIYITEGGLRGLHRKLSPDPDFQHNGLLHSFKRVDSELIQPGKVFQITMNLWPISVLVKKGHRLRIAIAGADADTFDRVPATEDPVITVYRNSSHPSFLDLPVLTSD